MKKSEIINARHTARISKAKDADKINTLLTFLEGMEPGTYTHEVTSEAVRDAVRNARTSPRRVFTELIREAMTGQRKAVQILILLTLCLIVLAAISLIAGLLAGATAQVFFSLMLTRGPLETTNSLFMAAETGITFRSVEIHGSAGTYHDRLDRDMYERGSDWSRLTNKLELYDHSPLINLIAGKHEHYKIEVTHKILGLLHITFDEPINVYFGSIGGKHITHPVKSMTGRISWTWSGPNEIEIIINNLKYIS